MTLRRMRARRTPVRRAGPTRYPVAAPGARASQRAARRARPRRVACQARASAHQAALQAGAARAHRAALRVAVPVPVPRVRAARYRAAELLGPRHRALPAAPRAQAGVRRAIRAAVRKQAVAGERRPARVVVRLQLVRTPSRCGWLERGCPYRALPARRQRLQART